jgi:hypothetical protein
MGTAPEPNKPAAFCVVAAGIGCWGAAPGVMTGRGALPFSRARSLKSSPADLLCSSINRSTACEGLDLSIAPVVGEGALMTAGAGWSGTSSASVVDTGAAWIANDQHKLSKTGKPAQTRFVLVMDTEVACSPQEAC